MRDKQKKSVSGSGLQIRQLLKALKGRRTYIERDVRLMLDAGDWQQFGRFVQMVAALSAQEINYSQLGRKIGDMIKG